MRVLVTGGAGFIGANLCRRLAEAGTDVVALDDLTSVESVARVIEAAVQGRVTHPEPVNLADRVGDVRHSQADSTLLRDLFPEVEPVALELALWATVAWYRAALAGGPG